MEEKKEERKNMPIVETKLQKSKDGRYVIHKTIITDIKPLKYYITMIERPIGEFVPHEDTQDVIEEPVI